MDDDTLCALALHRTPGVGPALWRRLHDAFGSPAGVLGAPDSALRSLGVPAETRTAIARPDWRQAQADAAWLDGGDGRHLLRLDTPDYPARLAETTDPPPLLFVTGCPQALGHPQVAIVGSRHASASGQDLAYDLAGALAESGLVVTSGLAAGIDAAAHRGALATAGGCSNAIIATGPDRTYPAYHRALQQSLAQHGAVAGENPPGTPPLAGLFPRRNRIVSGLSLAVVVVQAGTRSGALITARLAGEQGREVLAVPGSIHDPMARGCHALLRQGAKLVESVHDILEELPGHAFEAPAPQPQAVNLDPAAPSPDDDEQILLKALGYDPVPLDTLLQRSGLTLDRLSSILLDMELKGLVAAVPGGRYQRRKPEG